MTAHEAESASISEEPRRLRATELDLARIKGEIGENMRERIVALEAQQPYLATKADLETAKRWWLGSSLSALISVLGAFLTAAIILLSRALFGG